jgi:hypothetical protein
MDCPMHSISRNLGGDAYLPKPEALLFLRAALTLGGCGRLFLVSPRADSRAVRSVVQEIVQGNPENALLGSDS